MKKIKNFYNKIFCIFSLIALTLLFMSLLSNYGSVPAYAGIEYTTPQVLIILDNSQSMDGDLSGAIMTGSGTVTADNSSSSPIDYTVPSGFTAPVTGATSGSAPYTVTDSSKDEVDNSASRLNVAKEAIMAVYKQYSNIVQFGLMDYGVQGSPSVYTTWVYYMSGPNGFEFGNSPTAPSGLQAVHNPCYQSNSNSCNYIDQLYNNLYNPYYDSELYIQDTSDEPDINDVLYAGAGLPTNFVNYNGPNPSSPYPPNYYLTNYNNGTISESYYGGTDGTGGFSTSPTNAGYVPYSPQVWYSERGFGYYNSVSNSGNLVIPIAVSSSTQLSDFETALAPETNNPNTPEIKADAVNAPMASTLASALSYLTGQTGWPSLPSSTCPGKKYVIFVTDGLPTYGQNGNDWPPIGSAAASGYGVTATFNANGSLAYTHDNALQETINEITDLKNNGIDTYVVGLGAGVDTSANPQAVAVLKAMAIAGGTNNYFPASSASAVASDLGVIVEEIVASGSYTTPVIHQNTTSTNEYLYYADFNATLTQPLWGQGNVYMFQFDNGSVPNCPAPGLSNGLIGPENGVGPLLVCAETETTNSSGQTTTSFNMPITDSYWDSSGLGVGDALKNGKYFNNSTYRNVLTSYWNSLTGEMQQIEINPVSSLSLSNIDELENLLGLSSSNYSSICPNSSSESACLSDILNFALNPAADGWKLGAIYHSDPVLIGVPLITNYSSSSSYYQFYQNEEHRQQVLVVGANDGMLHGFDAGSYGSGPGSTSTTYGYGTGEEMFGYIPPDLLPKITSWYEDSISNPPSGYYPQLYFVDSTPAVSDVYFNNEFDGTLNNQSGVSSGWHTVLVSGERMGGQSYFALDVTHPSQISSSPSGYPLPLWDFTDSSMGYTWSRPVIGFVCLPKNSTSGLTNGICANNPSPSAPSSSSSAPEYVKTYIAIVGGGYPAGTIAGQHQGNAVYALYVQPNPVPPVPSEAPYSDNQELWKFTSSTTPVMDSVPSQVDPIFTPLTPGNEGGGGIEAFYVGDLGGNMWAFNIPFGTQPSSWTGCAIFSSTANPEINFYYPPVTATDDSNNLWVYFGSGNRDNLSSINSRPNEFIAANMGTASPGSCQTVSPQTATPYHELPSGSTSTTGLENVTGAEITASASSSTSSVANTSQWEYTLNGRTVSLSSASASVNPDGWYITLQNSGEKVVSSPIVVNGIVYFTTYTPPPASSANACTEGGTARLYALNYTNGGGEASDNSSGYLSSILNTSTSPPPSGATGQQSGIIGSGVPSAPVLVGKNLVISTSLGGFTTVTISTNPGKITPTSWFTLP